MRCSFNDLHFLSVVHRDDSVVGILSAADRYLVARWGESYTQCLAHTSCHQTDGSAKTLHVRMQL